MFLKAGISWCCIGVGGTMPLWLFPPACHYCSSGFQMPPNSQVGPHISSKDTAEYITLKAYTVAVLHGSALLLPALKKVALVGWVLRPRQEYLFFLCNRAVCPMNKRLLGWLSVPLKISVGTDSISRANWHCKVSENWSVGKKWFRRMWWLDANTSTLPNMTTKIVSAIFFLTWGMDHEMVTVL